MEEYDFLFKCIVLGDGGCGKTALTVRFSQGYFQESYKMTVGVDFSVKLLEVADKRAKLQIWDTGGQERFSFVRPLYYRGAMGALLVFDVTNRESFDHLPNWVEELESNAGKVPYVLVGNKIDLPRAVGADEAWAFCKQMGIPYYYETSAKTGESVGDCFHGLAYAMMNVKMPPEAYPNVMKQLGAVPGMAAPAAAAARPQLAIPQVQAAAPAAIPVADEFGGADEYADVEVPAPAPVPAPRPAAAPVVQPLPRPVAATPPKPAVAPLPRPVAAPVPRPAAAAPRPAAAPAPRPAVHPVPQAQQPSRPTVQPVARPAAPSVQPLPKPTPIALSVPAAQPQPRAQPAVKPKPAAVVPAPAPKAAVNSVALFSAAEEIAEEPPVEMPELPPTKPVVPGRQVKPIPVVKPSVEEALPEIDAGMPEVEEVAPRPVATRPVAKAAGGPVVFSKQPAAATPAKAAPRPAAATPAKAAPQPAAAKASAGSSTSSFLAALTAKSHAATPAGGSGGAIPFSAGFTAKKTVSSGGAAAKPSGMSIFFQASIPEDLLHMKKQKKKAEVKAVAGGAAAAATSDVIKCPGCGYSVSSRMRFCNKCGTRLK
nr:GTP-binding protein [Candidatus Sigynarchaeum springense]